MPTVTRVLLPALALAGFVLLNELLAPSLPLLPFRLPLLLLLAFAAAMLRPAGGPENGAADSAQAAEHLVAEVNHAVEHLRGFVLVLGVSEEYGQRLPRTARSSLELALKHLEKACEPFQAKHRSSLMKPRCSAAGCPWRCAPKGGTSCAEVFAMRTLAAVLCTGLGVSLIAGVMSLAGAGE